MKFAKPLSAILIAAFSVYCVLNSNADDPASESGKNTFEARIHRLQTERIELLKKRLEQLTGKYENGHVMLDSVLDAEHDVLEAELDSCRTKAERIVAYQPIIKNRIRIEELRETGFENGKCTEDVLLAARAERLNAQISQMKELPPHATITLQE